MDWLGRAQKAWHTAEGTQHVDYGARQAQISIAAALISIAETLEQRQCEHLYCPKCNKRFETLQEAAEHYRDHNIAKNNGG
jgi:predicted nucleic acid-binding Zn ribbon protein